ncbi:Uncharacterized protein Rs2_05311 [Raphanus sativus]|nr:Uncharacterized protein Rs2_05311 [Raphanus sativus]
MAVTMKHMSLIVSLFGVLSFLLGVIAENKKPASGTPINGKGVVICKYPSDPNSVLFKSTSYGQPLRCLFASYDFVLSKALRQTHQSVLLLSIGIHRGRAWRQFGGVVVEYKCWGHPCFKLPGEAADHGDSSRSCRSQLGL